MRSGKPHIIGHRLYIMEKLRDSFLLLSEGMTGLNHAFMYAGTPAIAVTLWSVETFSAKALDIGMFEHLKAGQPPVHALRSIKLRVLRGEPWLHASWDLLKFFCKSSSNAYVSRNHNSERKTIAP